MKKFIIILFATILIGGIAAFVLYKYYLPEVIADAVVADDLPDYLPKPVKTRIEKIREPVNAGAEDVVKEIHDSDIAIEKILEMIDRTTEDMSNEILDELNRSKITTTDQAFDIIKKHVKADFDLEVLRKPFNENVDVKMIRKAIGYGNINRKSKDIDLETAKVIAKRILIEKEKQYRK
jgi:hypothetical protein